MAKGATQRDRPPTCWERDGRLLVGCLIGLAILWSFGGTIGKPDCQDMDFGAYYRAAVAVGRGESPYTLDEEDHGFPPRAKRLEGYPPFGAFPYPPAYAYLLSPLRYLAYPWACRVWMFLNWLAAGIALGLCGSLVRGARQSSREAGAVLLLTAIPLAAYIWMCVRLGQIALLMTGGCIGWAWCQRRGRPFLGGLLLAAASAIKLAPLALVPYLVLQRDRRGLAGVAVGLLAVFMLPAAWVGWDGVWRVHQEWVHHTIVTDVPLQTYRPGNQSLLGVLARLPPFGDGHRILDSESFDALKRAYPIILAWLAAVLYGWIFWDRRAHRDSLNPEQAEHQDRAHLALLFVFLTIAHPHAWRCNYVGLLFPCALLASRAWHRCPGCRLAVAALGLVLLACAWPTDGVGTAGWSFVAWLLLGKHFWGGVAVAVACLWNAGPPASRQLLPQGASGEPALATSRPPRPSAAAA